MENLERREKIKPTKDQDEFFHRVFYDAKNKKYKYGDSNLALVMRRPALLSVRRKVIHDFAKEHGLDPLTVIHETLERTSGSGWGSSIHDYPHWAEARMHLQKMLPREYWIQRDAEKLQRLADGFKKNEIPGYLGKTTPNERNWFIENLEAMAKAVEKETQPKGGRPTGEAKEKFDKVKQLERKIRQMQEDHSSKLKSEKDAHNQTWKELQDARKEARDAQTSAERVQEEAAGHQRDKTSAEQEAGRLKTQIQEALGHVNAAHGSVKAVMMPARLKKVKEALIKARKALE